MSPQVPTAQDLQGYEEAVKAQADRVRAMKVQQGKDNRVCVNGLACGKAVAI
jgi:hypothetical protein